jgi:hypothetical protein
MPIGVPPTMNRQLNEKTERNKVKKPARRKARKARDKVTGQPPTLTATTTTAPAAPQDDTTVMPDDAGVFSTGPSYAPEYHYHADTTGQPYQVAAQVDEAMGAASG